MPDPISLPERYSRRYFLDQLAEFRQRMGQKDFWRDDLPDRALLAVTFVYVRADLEEGDEHLWTGTMEEFARRRLLVELQQVLEGEVAP